MLISQGTNNKKYAEGWQSNKIQYIKPMQELKILDSE
jgi:hypothetical protein